MAAAPRTSNADAAPSPCGESEEAGLPKPTAEAAYQLLRRDAVGAEP